MPLSTEHPWDLVRTVLIAVALFGLLLFWSPGVGAGADPSASDATTEGITVHGNWTIDVHDPDGTLAADYAVNNALLSSGGIILSHLLTGEGKVTNWELSLIGGDDSPCLDANGDPRDCWITTDQWSCSNCADYFFPTLEWESGTGWDGGNDGTVIVSGSFVAPADGSLTRYRSGVLVSKTAESGGMLVDIPFAGKDFEEPVLVSEGQQVTVRVVYSFD